MEQPLAGPVGEAEGRVERVKQDQVIIGFNAAHRYASFRRCC